MKLFKEDSQEETPECPVCYECLSGTERTLSCGHVFCHDCLVKTLVTVNSDGTIRDTIICPICRHLTFIEKQKKALESSAEAKEERQTLEVPLRSQPGRLQSARRASGDSLPGGLNCILHCFRGISQRVHRERRIRPGQNGSQIFIISAQGRPMTDRDAPHVAINVTRPQQRRRSCTNTTCLFCLVSVFTLFAVVASVFPWVVLM